MEEISNNLFSAVLEDLANINKAADPFLIKKTVLIVTNSNEAFYGTVNNSNNIPPESVIIGTGNDEAHIRIDEINKCYVGEFKKVPHRDLYGAMLVSLDNTTHVLIIEHTGDITIGCKNGYSRGGYPKEGTAEIVKASVSISNSVGLWRIEIDAIKYLFFKR
jgi:hypothetical protein